MKDQGKILWYHPGDGKGVLLSETGKEVRFVLTDASLDLHGGDVVTFRTIGTGTDAYAADLRLVERCISHLLNHNDGLAHLFHQTITLPSPPPQRATA